MKRPNCLTRFMLKLMPSPVTLLSLTAWFFPKSIKRKIVMVICFCEMERMRGVDNPRVDRLNDALELISTPSFLLYICEFAMPVSDNFFVCVDEPCVTDLAAVCEFFVTKLPDFLIYGTTDEMVTDIATVVAFDVS